MTERVTILNTKMAGEDHAVHELKIEKNDTFVHRKSPCDDCPWRKDAVGEFPAEAFRHSAHTAYDMSTKIFSCHSSGIKKPAVCAGFLLSGADHNLAVRLAYINGKYRGEVTDGGHELHDSYRDMAVANGVDETDPVLKLCR